MISFKSLRVRDNLLYSFKKIFTIDYSSELNQQVAIVFQQSWIREDFK